MKNFYKIAIGFILLVLIVGVVSAVDTDDFKYPDSFKKTSGSGGYINNQGQGMIVFDYNESKEVFFTNHTNYVFKEFGNNKYVFFDGTSGLSGFFEVIEFNGEKVIVVSSVLSDKIDENTGVALLNLKEFNRLNNVEAISV